MANTLASTVWSITNTGVLTTDPIKIKGIMVPTGAALTLKDNKTSANTVFDPGATGWYHDVCTWFLGGVQVTAVTNTCYIYLE